MNALLRKIRRGLRKPPAVVARRIAMEFRRAKERCMFRLRVPGTNPAQLLRATNSKDIGDLWQRLASRPYVSWIPSQEEFASTRTQLDRICPGEVDQILARAELAIAHRVNLLGSGDIELGERIDWHRDYKTGLGWACEFSPDIDYVNLDRPSDVKFPWELSRLQWLVPVGQAYCLTGDERYAHAVRRILTDWIDSNPPLQGPNWCCTMEIALRVHTWSWFFHVFQASVAWSDQGFQKKFLASLFTHGQFTEEYLEYSDINGNHCTADAAGMVFAGLFFGDCAVARRWLDVGWKLLCEEFPRQVYPDGVDFEASISYHRLVQELFFLPALYRERCALGVPADYRDRVLKMARFTQAYSRDDGTIPLVGDADDARALPFGGQAINDHRYLLGIVGTAWKDKALVASFSGSRAESFWLLGPALTAEVPQREQRPAGCRASQAFPDGGFYVMANGRDHVLIDCGPIGLGGRGGHGHNDCLSVDIVLGGVQLVTDSGSFVYTADAAARNRFRSTQAHNTPQVCGEEINRFPLDGSLWSLQHDAKPEVLAWQPGPKTDLFRGSHSGYLRLSPAVRPVRTVTLNHEQQSIEIWDFFECSGTKDITVEVPLHFAPGVNVTPVDNRFRLTVRDQQFWLDWKGNGAWESQTQAACTSPTYGVCLDSERISWRGQGTGLSLQVTISADLTEPIA